MFLVISVTENKIQKKKTKVIQNKKCQTSVTYDHPYSLLVLTTFIQIKVLVFETGCGKLSSDRDIPGRMDL